MQVSGTFPELSAGLKKSKKAKKDRPEYASDTDKMRGVGGFALKGRGPKAINAPKTFSGRRAASHAKAYRNKV